MKITEKTTIVEALKISKKVAQVLGSYNLDCAGCRGAENDTVEMVAVNNGLDLKKFLSELNAAHEQK